MKRVFYRGELSKDPVRSRFADYKYYTSWRKKAKAADYENKTFDTVEFAVISGNNMETYCSFDTFAEAEAYALKLTVPAIVRRKTLTISLDNYQVVGFTQAPVSAYGVYDVVKKWLPRSRAYQLGYAAYPNHARSAVVGIGSDRSDWEEGWDDAEEDANKTKVEMVLPIVGIGDSAKGGAK